MVTRATTRSSPSCGISICRSRGKDYLNLAYLGRPPEQLSAEEEADLPKEVR
jgi:hypothetical protein